MSVQVMSAHAVVIDRSMSRLQFLTLFLCFLVVAADGFDLASVAYVGPLLKNLWHLAPAQLGPIFGAGLFGLTVGSFVFGPLADRIGRRRVITISMILFGLGSLACAAAPSLSWLIALRFLTGAGLGGAMPNAITLSAEFSPARNRTFLVTLMFCGFTLGLAFAGLVASLLIPAFGWPGVFVFGGVAPLLLSPFIWAFLPESLQFMHGRKSYEQEARRVIKRMTGDENTPFAAISPETSSEGKTETPVKVLFSQHFRAGTLLLWLTFFCTLWVYYQISNWLPLVITNAGIDVVHAARVGAMLPLGGTLGSLINARLMDRMNPFRVLALSYVVAAVSIGLIGVCVHAPMWVYVAVFFAGLGLSGAQTGANVLAARFYTAGARATGVSWALGAGRIGSIIGSMTGGFVLLACHSVSLAFLVFAVPAVVAGMAMFVNGILYRGGLTQI